MSKPTVSQAIAERCKTELDDFLKSPTLTKIDNVYNKLVRLEEEEYDAEAESFKKSATKIYKYIMASIEDPSDSNTEKLIEKVKQYRDWRDAVDLSPGFAEPPEKCIEEWLKKGMPYHKTQSAINKRKNRSLSPLSNDGDGQSPEELNEPQRGPASSDKGKQKEPEGSGKKTDASGEDSAGSSKQKEPEGSGKKTDASGEDSTGSSKQKEPEGSGKKTDTSEEDPASSRKQKEPGSSEDKAKLSKGVRFSKRRNTQDWASLDCDELDDLEFEEYDPDGDVADQIGLEFPLQKGTVVGKIQRGAGGFLYLVKEDAGDGQCRFRLLNRASIPLMSAEETTNAPDLVKGRRTTVKNPDQSHEWPLKKLKGLRQVAWETNEFDPEFALQSLWPLTRIDAAPFPVTLVQVEWNDNKLTWETRTGLRSIYHDSPKLRTLDKTIFKQAWSREAAFLRECDQEVPDIRTIQELRIESLSPYQHQRGLRLADKIQPDDAYDSFIEGLGTRWYSTKSRHERQEPPEESESEDPVHQSIETSRSIRGNKQPSDKSRHSTRDSGYGSRSPATRSKRST